MKQARAKIGEILKESQIMSLRFTANEIAQMAGVSIGTAVEILHEFGWVVDGHRWTWRHNGKESS